MIKEKLIEIVRLRVKPVVDETSLIHEAYVEKVMSTLYAQMVQAYVSKNTRGNTRYFTKDFELAVSQNAITDIYFSEYGVQVISVNDAAGAARFVTTKKDRGLVFAPIMDVDLELIQSLQSYQVDTKAKYISGRDYIQYDGIPPDVVTEGVLARLLLSFDAFDYNDDIFIPEELQKTFIDETVKFVASERDVDLINDNA